MMRTLAAVLAAATIAMSASAAEILPFIEDDYAKAVAHAKTKKLQIFVEAWAPW